MPRYPWYPELYRAHVQTQRPSAGGSNGLITGLAVAATMVLFSIIVLLASSLAV